VAYALSDDIKIINFKVSDNQYGRPNPSDSWASFVIKGMLKWSFYPNCVRFGWYLAIILRAMWSKSLFSRYRQSPTASRSKMSTSVVIA